MKRKFKIAGTYLPVTPKHFEDLTNELLKEVNELADPMAFDADYMAQVLYAAIHSLGREVGFVQKDDLFQRCVNRIGNHVTYNAVEEIQKKLGKSAESDSDDGLAEVELPKLEEVSEEKQSAATH